MDYAELFREDNEKIEERYELSMERIEEILTEDSVKQPYRDFFVRTSEFILKIRELVSEAEQRRLEKKSLGELEKLNYDLYRDILPEHYENSYANPTYAKEKLGEYGKLLSFLYTEIRGMIVYAYEHRKVDITICMELFIEIYNYFEEEELNYSNMRKAVYWFVSDYTDITVAYRVRELVDPTLSFASDIIMKSDLNDIRYLYRYGEYISDTERKMAEFLNTLPEAEIEKMAETYTEGYRRGFELARKDLSKKKTVNIRYPIGFERIVRASINQFAKMGLKPVIYRVPVNSVNKNGAALTGYSSYGANRQYEYDHRYDSGLYMDKALNERKLGVLRVAFERYKELAYKHAGPAVIETFGEEPFVPVNKKEAVSLDKKQQKLSVAYRSESGKITNDYIRGDERSFTIIAYPIPMIGEHFQEIFKETVKINTLDYNMYRDIQAKLIAALDQGDHVRILGRGNNKTDLRVKLHELKNREKETNFENCLADVNIPLGEVFTSPKLEGTNGILYVSEVYLGDLNYKDLTLHFEDGRVVDYSCSNFETEEENRKFIHENLMYNHDGLPLGEFAIGTNTTAYVMANQYDIVYRLPILIVEKMGPHFAVGDTCYSWSEDLPVYNPDGKEVTARDNEISILRKDDISRAYFNCHTDITIPYEEIFKISVVTKEGLEIKIIENGRFVLAGCEELNKPFENTID